jgi:RNA polymerase sigma factor (sigma-70 family)
VTNAKKGDQSAWEAVYFAYGAALLGFLMLRLRHPEDARDALSETFLRAIDKAAGFRGDAVAFRAWLFQIARNVATDRIRHRDRLLPSDELPDGVDGSGSEPGERLIAEEEAAQARAAFASLPSADQELLWLRICSGLSSEEVGRILKRRPGTVRMQQLRALEAMARRLLP